MSLSQKWRLTWKDQCKWMVALHIFWHLWHFVELSLKVLVVEERIRISMNYYLLVAISKFDTLVIGRSYRLHTMDPRTSKENVIR